MSIGPSQPSGYILPSSIIGAASRSIADSDQAKGDQSVQNLRGGQDRLADKDVGDVLETSLSADRDVDGRLPYDLPPEEQESGAETQDDAGAPKALDSVARSEDVDHERGSQLDLDA